MASCSLSVVTTSPIKSSSLPSPVGRSGGRLTRGVVGCEACPVLDGVTGMLTAAGDEVELLCRSWGVVAPQLAATLALSTRPVELSKSMIGLVDLLLAELLELAAATESDEVLVKGPNPGTSLNSLCHFLELAHPAKAPSRLMSPSGPGAS